LAGSILAASGITGTSSRPLRSLGESPARDDSVLTENLIDRLSPDTAPGELRAGHDLPHVGALVGHPAPGAGLHDPLVRDRGDPLGMLPSEHERLEAL